MLANRLLQQLVEGNVMSFSDEALAVQLQKDWVEKYALEFTDRMCRVDVIKGKYLVFVQEIEEDESVS